MQGGRHGESDGRSDGVKNHGFKGALTLRLEEGSSDSSNWGLVDDSESNGGLKGGSNGGSNEFCSQTPESSERSGSVMTGIFVSSVSLSAASEEQQVSLAWLSLNRIPIQLKLSEAASYLTWIVEKVPQYSSLLC